MMMMTFVFKRGLYADRPGVVHQQLGGVGMVVSSSDWQLFLAGGETAHRRMIALRIYIVDRWALTCDARAVYHHRMGDEQFEKAPTTDRRNHPNDNTK